MDKRTESARKWVVFFDADCGVCSLCVEKLRAWDAHGRATFVPNHSIVDYPGLPAEITLELIDKTIVVLVENAEDAEGRTVLTKSAAIAELLTARPGGKAIAFVMRLPGIRWLMDIGYNLVARNRARISTLLGLNACKVPNR